MADHMLRRLSKWLRFMGFYTQYPGKNAGDNTIIAECEEKGLILLTRDHELYSRYPRSILIRSEDFRDQVIQVISSFPPASEEYFTRCPECNSVLGYAKDPSKHLEVPEAVISGGKEVLECPGCGKVYWKGSHYDKILWQIKKFEESIK